MKHHSRLLAIHEPTSLELTSPRALSSTGTPVKAFILIIVVMVTLTAQLTFAQPASRSTNSRKAQVAKTKRSSKSSGKVIEFKQLRLEGNVQRPSAAYFVQRKKLKFKGLIPKKSFISKIKKSVTKSPF